MKIAFVSTPTRTNMPNLVPPFGVMYLASYLREKGHIVTIIDIAKTRQNNSITIKELKEYNPDLIGVSGIITAYKFVGVLAKELKKELPDIPLVIGGHVTLDNSHLLLQKFHFDYVIEGYGEKSLEYLIEYLNGKRNINCVEGLSYLKNGEVIVNTYNNTFFKNFDEYPLPAYDLVDMEYYITNCTIEKKLESYLNKTGKKPPLMRHFLVVASRGCTDKCCFCVHEFGAYKGFHVHSIEHVIKNIRVLYDEYNVRIFHMGGELFLHNIHYATCFVEAMNMNFPDAYFSVMTRADSITPEFMGILNNSNCFSLEYGFESGSNKILKILNKRMTRDVNINAYKLIRSSDITPSVSFMVGTPGETVDTIKDTVDALREAGVEDGGMFFTTPYPGSRLFRWCIEQGIIEDKDSYLDNISNRDASELVINLTGYPDFIVKIMEILLKNRMYCNRWSFHMSLFDRFKRFIVCPLLFELYFIYDLKLQYGEN